MAKGQENPQPKGRKNKSKWGVFIFLFLCIVAALIGSRFGREKAKVDDSEKQYEELQKEKDKQKLPDLKKKYKDMVGWIEIKGTGFSYPVMQTRLEPDYYLHRDVHGAYSFYGTPFLDSRCSLKSDICIIYGHNINGRRYFGYLQNYRDAAFYREHPDLYFTRGNRKETYSILSVIKTDVDSEVYRYPDIYNEEEYRDVVRHLIADSIYRCDVTDEVEKEMREKTVEAFFHEYQFVALSTCRTTEGRDKRLLVIGCKKRQ